MRLKMFTVLVLPVLALATLGVFLLAGCRASSAATSDGADQTTNIRARTNDGGSLGASAAQLGGLSTATPIPQPSQQPDDPFITDRGVRTVIIAETAQGPELRECFADALVAVEGGRVTEVTRQVPSADVRPGELVQGFDRPFPMTIPVHRGPAGELLPGHRECQVVRK